MPLSIAILIDSSTDNLTQTMIKENVVPLVGSMSAFDEAALFVFEHTTNQVQTFTSNQDDLVKAFNRITLGGNSPTFDGLGNTPFSNAPMINGVPLATSTGKVQPSKTLNTHIDDAVFTAAQALRLRGKDHRKIILLISNGQNAPGNRNSFGKTMESISTADIIVYAVSQGSSVVTRGLSNRAARYAHETGGDVYYPVRSTGFSNSYQRISQTARNQYILGYSSSNQAEKITYRKITVEITGLKSKSFKVRHRKGYYAVPSF
jgi:VWFA-related protein